MEWYMYLLILGGGILTGFINTLSGNGSVISLPLLAFQASSQIEWVPGLVLAAGTAFGAWVAARMAVDKGAAWVHRLLILVVILSAVYLLGIFEWIGRLIGL